MPSATITTLCDMISHARVQLDDERDVSDLTGDNLSILEQAAESADSSNLLWSDEELTLYANQAVYEVALRTLCLGDSITATEGFNQFTLAVADDPWVTIDPRILQIRRVKWNGMHLKRRYDSRFDQFRHDWQEDTGRPCEFVLNIQERRLRPYPKDTADGVLSLEVVRLPLTTMSEPDDVPEIPQHMLLETINWMLHLAYLKNDADTKDESRSAMYEALFRQRFGERPSQRHIEFMFDAAQRNRGRVEYY